VRKDDSVQDPCRVAERTRKTVNVFIILPLKRTLSLYYTVWTSASLPVSPAPHENILVIPSWPFSFRMKKCEDRKEILPPWQLQHLYTYTYVYINMYTYIYRHCKTVETNSSHISSCSNDCEWWWLCADCGPPIASLTRIIIAIIQRS